MVAIGLSMLSVGLSGCVSQIAAAPSNARPAAPTPSASTPVGPVKPASILSGDCRQMFTDSEMSSTIGQAVTGKLVAQQGAGLSLEVFGGIECDWSNSSGLQAWITAIPASSVHDAAGDAAYCYGAGRQLACSFGAVASGIWLAGVLYTATGQDEGAARAAVAALEGSFAARAPSETVSAMSLPTGSWSAITDCGAFSTRAGIPAAGGDPALVASAGNLAGEAGPGYYAATKAAGYSTCGWSDDADPNGFTIELVPGAGWYAVEASSLAGWKPVSVAGAALAGVLPPATDRAQSIVVSDGVNLLLVQSNSTQVLSGRFAPVAAAAFAAVSRP